MDLKVDLKMNFTMDLKTGFKMNLKMDIKMDSKACPQDGPRYKHHAVGGVRPLNLNGSTPIHLTYRLS